MATQGAGGGYQPAAAATGHRPWRAGSSERCAVRQPLAAHRLSKRCRQAPPGKGHALGLAQQGPRLYLVCRYEGFDNERSLALHRITQAEASTLAFERPAEFDLQKYDEDGRFGFGEGQRVRLTFCIENDAGFHLRETPLSKDQQVHDQEDGWMKISATVVDSAMLDWWLRGFGQALRGVQKTPLTTKEQ